MTEHRYPPMILTPKQQYDPGPCVCGQESNFIYSNHPLGTLRVATCVSCGAEQALNRRPKPRPQKE